MGVFVMFRRAVVQCFPSLFVKVTLLRVCIVFICVSCQRCGLITAKAQDLSFLTVGLSRS